MKRELHVATFPAPRRSGVMESRAALEEKILRQMVELAERLVVEFNLQVDSVNFKWEKRDIGGGLYKPVVRRVNMNTTVTEYVKQR